MNERFFQELLDTSLQMAQTRVLVPLLEYIMQVAIELVGAEYGHLILVNPDGALDFRVSLDSRGQAIENPETQVSHSILNEVVTTNTPLVLVDALDDPSFGDATSVGALELRSVMCVPLAIRGRAMGAIYVENRADAGVFEDRDLEPLTYFGTQAAVFIENAFLNDDLETQVKTRTTKLRETNARLRQEIAERERVEEALRESEGRLNLALEASHEGIYDWSVQTGEAYLAPRFYTMLGYEPYEFPPSFEAFVDLVHPHDRHHVHRTVRECAEQKRETFELELRCRTKAGNYRWMLNRGQVTERDERGRPVRMIGTHTDITGRKQAERALQQAKEVALEAQRAAEAANRAKSVFLANMSHELRTPLNAILGYAQLMARDVRITPTQQEYLETIARSGEHLLGLINNVLTMSQIEAGRTTLQENAFDLHWQLRGLQEILQMRAEDKGLALRLDIAPDVPRHVYADEGKLRQVLANLLDNAVKFTEKGSITLRVKHEDVPRLRSEGSAMKREDVPRLRSESSPMKRETDQARETADTPYVSSRGIPSPEGRITHHVSHITFEVEDTGVGIAPEEMDALFDPFVQTASGHRSHEGTGLGLPISRQFVELMGGEISVNSIVGQGTTFRVQVPVALVDEGTAQARDLQPWRRVTGIEPGQTAPDGGPFRLLVVEDKPTNRELLVKLLEPFGFDVRCAVNGAEGVEMWEAWQPHLVWMDVRLPVMDGYEATRQIKARAQATGRQTIIVAVTASAFEEDREAILAAGCDDFVRKPFREGEIYDVLRRYLGVRFVYETATPVPEAAASVSPEALRAAVETLPAAWATELYQAAVALDADRMLSLIEAVHTQTPHLADTLAAWVRDFEYEKLMALIAPEA